MDLHSNSGSAVIRSLASGSAANALLVRASGVTLLIDCGLPIRALTAALLANGLGLEDIDLVFVTHEHSDHVRSLPQLRSRGATIVTSAGTARALRLAPSEFIPAAAGKTRDIAGCSLTPIPVSHDSAEPLGVTLRFADHVLTVVTDVGCASEHLIESIVASTIVVLEANHDTSMLRNGPYPPHLKRRIASKTGHLSNAECATTLIAAYERGARPASIFLSHLSRTNNDAPVAESAVARLAAVARIMALPPRNTVDLLAPPPLTSVDRREMHQSHPAQISLWGDELAH
jgi:phosphoribosyl 1,2-cyclic phosphodiesterase